MAVLAVLDGSNPRHSWRWALILLAAFMINFTASGILFGFGVFQAEYESMASRPDTTFTGASAAEIDLIGTLSASLMTMCAPFVVACAKYFKPQAVVCAGGVLFGLTHVLASFGKALWHFQLAQGVLLGFARGLSFVPSTTVAPTWFTTHRGLAMGIVSSGTGIGGLVWAPATSACVDSMGFRNTLRLMGCLATVLICLSGAVLDWEPSMAAQLHAQNQALSPATALFRILHPGWQTMKQRKFVAQTANTVFQSAAYYTPVFFTVVYAKTLGYSDSDGANLAAVRNACNAVGKIAVGFTADRTGRFNSFLLAAVLGAVVSLGLWLPSTVVATADEATARSLFVSFTVLYGLFASAYLFPVALIELFGVLELPRIAGIMYMLQGVGILVGTPVAGVLVQGHGELSKDPDSYMSMAVMVGVLMSVAAVAAAVVRVDTMVVPGGDWEWKWKA